MPEAHTVTPEEAAGLAEAMKPLPPVFADLARTVATEPERIQVAQEQAWDAACDYLASRNWKDLTHAEYTAALLKAWNANPHRGTSAAAVIENGADL